MQAEVACGYATRCRNVLYMPQVDDNHGLYAGQLATVRNEGGNTAAAGSGPVYGGNRPAGGGGGSGGGGGGWQRPSGYSRRPLSARSTSHMRAEWYVPVRWPVGFHVAVALLIGSSLVQALHPTESAVECVQAV